VRRISRGWRDGPAHCTVTTLIGGPKAYTGSKREYAPASAQSFRVSLEAPYDMALHAPVSVPSADPNNRPGAGAGAGAGAGVSVETDRD
jgi:hypothetical protein